MDRMFLVKLSTLVYPQALRRKSEILRFTAMFAKINAERLKMYPGWSEWCQFR